MEAVDWKGAHGACELSCLLVSPNDRDEVVGELELEPEGCSLTAGYYSDTRVGASVRVSNWSDWPNGAWLRLVQTVRGTDYVRELGTFAPFEDGDERQSGWTATDVTLASALKTLECDVWPPTWTVGRGATARSSLQRLCDNSGHPCAFMPGFSDYRFTSTRTYDYTQSFLSIMFDMCDAAGARLDVDGHGVVTFSRYVAPSMRTASFLLDASARDTLVLDQGIQRSCDALSLPNRSAVVFKDGDDELVAWSDLPQRHPFSASSRGYTRTEVHELNDMPEPRNARHAQQLADSYLSTDSQTATEWTVSTLWWDAWPGDVGEFDPGDGSGARRVLVKSVDADLSKWTLKLTLKEV